MCIPSQVHGTCCIHSSAGVEVGFQQTLYMINESSSNSVMVCAVVVSGRVAVGSIVQLQFQPEDTGAASGMYVIGVLHVQLVFLFLW